MKTNINDIIDEIIFAVEGKFTDDEIAMLVLERFPSFIDDYRKEISMRLHEDTGYLLANLDTEEDAQEVVRRIVFGEMKRRDLADEVKAAFVRANPDVFKLMQENPTMTIREAMRKLGKWREH